MSTAAGGTCSTDALDGRSEEANESLHLIHASVWLYGWSHFSAVVRIGFRVSLIGNELMGS